MNVALIEALFFDAIFAAVAAIGFAVISNPPKRAILISALLAAIGHALRYYMINYIDVDITAASLVAAFIIGMFSMWFAKMIHCPAEVFSFPSLLPMIPGMYAYKTVLGLIRFMRCEDQSLMPDYIVMIFQNGLTTLFVLFALVIGVSLPLFIFHKQSFMMTRILKRG